MTSYQIEIANYMVGFMKTAEGKPATEQDIIGYFVNNRPEAYGNYYRDGHIITMIGILVKLGILYEKIPNVPGNDVVYFLSPKGWSFNTMNKLLQQEREKEEQARIQIQSVIDTNRSVRETNQIQRRILLITAGVSLASVIIALLTYFKNPTTVIKVNPSPVQILTSQEAKQNHVIVKDSIRK